MRLKATKCVKLCSFVCNVKCTSYTGLLAMLKLYYNLFIVWLYIITMFSILDKLASFHHVILLISQKLFQILLINAFAALAVKLDLLALFIL